MRVSPKNLATSAAGWPTSSTARKATRDLASEYRLCLFPEHINSGLTPNFPATASTSSSIGRLGRYFFSSLTADSSRVVLQFLVFGADYMDDTVFLVIAIESGHPDSMAHNPPEAEGAHSLGCSRECWYRACTAPPLELHGLSRQSVHDYT